nr:reverse transcriptase domain-containing protein [Tanacetum cinerariifolium]
MFLGKYFPPSMVTKLRNEITNFRQRVDESLFKAWKRYKLSIDRCPNHNMLPVTQIDTFYNGLTLRNRDTINAAPGRTFIKRRPEECYDLIENMTAHDNDWDTSVQRSESSSSITSSSDSKIVALKAEMAEINKNLMKVLQINQQVKAVAHNCETCGGPHSYNDCPATVGQTQNLYAAGAYNQGDDTASSSGSGTLPSNTITNPKEDLKGITTRSVNAYKGPTIPTTSSLPKVVERETEVTKDIGPPTNNESTKYVQPTVVQIETPIPNSEPVVAPIADPIVAPVSAPKHNQKPSIPHPSRLHDQKLRDKTNDQKEKFFKIFQHLDFNISFADALILMPKRSFLKIGRALIDVYEGELTLRVGNKAITFNLDQTSRYSANYDAMEIFFSLKSFLMMIHHHHLSLCKNSKLLNLPMKNLLLMNHQWVEVKDLPPHLEYAFLEGDDKLPIIIAKDLKDEEKTALIKVLKSHKQALPWKLSDIKGVVLRQRKTKHFQSIHYASKTMTDAQAHYTTTEKELLVVAYAFEKFFPYLVLSKIIVYKDHSTLKYLFNKQDVKPRLLRWVLLLQEFDITVYDKKRSQEPSHRSSFSIREPSPKARKPLIFSRLATMDPPGDIVAQTTSPKRCLTLVFIGLQSIEMPTTWSNYVTLVNVREKFCNVMKCLKIPSKFVKSLTFGASISCGHSHIHEGTSIYSCPSIICQNGLKRKRSPPTTPELFANSKNISLLGLELPVLSLMIMVRTSAMTNSQRSCLSTMSLIVLLPRITLKLVGKWKSSIVV